MTKSWTRAAEDDAEEDPEETGVETELRREHRTDERPRAGDRREVMAEEDDTVRRVEVLSVLESVCRRDARVVEAEHFGGDERRVVAIGDRQDRQRPEHPPCGVHRGLLPHVRR